MPARVNLGPGDQRLPGHIGLDILKRAGTDVICDLNVSILLAPSSVEHIQAISLLSSLVPCYAIEYVLRLKGT